MKSYELVLTSLSKYNKGHFFRNKVVMHCEGQEYMHVLRELTNFDFEKTYKMIIFNDMTN